jgi:VWA domain-containing protein/HEAT repeat protein
MYGHRLPSALALLLGLIMSAALTAQEAPDFNAARSSFKREIDANRIEKRRAVIRGLVATRDERAVKEMRVAANKVRKEIDKQDKKLEPLRKKRAKVDEEIAKRFGTKKTVSAGSVNSLLEKKEEYSLEIQKRNEELALERSTLNALLVGIGDLIGALGDPVAGETSNELVKLAERIRKPEDRVEAIELLGFVRTPEAVLGLVGLALNSTDPVTRIAALDALVVQGDSRGADAAIAALEDEYWQVKSAAVNALSRFGKPAAIPSLIALLEKEEGRLKDDIGLALTSMSGYDFKGNVALWQRWWKEKGDTLTEAWNDLSHEDSVARNNARDTIRQEGFLLGVRRILDLEGLSMNAVRSEEARRRVDPEIAQRAAPGGVEGASVEDADLENMLDSVGGAIASRPAKIRDRALGELVMRPRSRTSNLLKKRKLTRIAGRTRSPESAAILMGILRRSDGDGPDDIAMRIAAIDGLGYCARTEDLPTLARLFGSRSLKVDELLALTRCLGQVGTKPAARQLVTALGEIESRGSDLDLSGVAKAVGDELRRLTGADASGGYAAWMAWWKKSGDDFETDRDREVAKEGKAKEGEDKDAGKYGFYGIETNSKRLCFVLDVSGSMEQPAEYADGKSTKLEVAKKELINAISGLPEDAAFNIIIYSTDLTLWQKKLQVADAKTKAKAKSWVAKLQANGNTNIYDALAKAFDFAGRGSFDKSYSSALDTIFFLSDGQPTAGKILVPNEILREVLDKNKLRRVVIHTIGVGRDHVRPFMRALATNTGGQYVAR